ncbi:MULTISPECIES: AIPR family protein [unclassified Curtobacterium]|uniref:AIPR family protein n=1 Tax=unclassified Curtobacterium TaxID=257496 RepID=UPI00226B5AC9|nr:MULTISPECIES: AIPR family protein [unclassified Curtobacterium]
MPSTPDQDIAQHAFAHYHQLNYPKLPSDVAFEHYSTALVTKAEGLGADALRSAILGASNDGGIDAFLILLNKTEIVDGNSRRLTHRKDSLEGLQKGVPLDVIVVQSKNQSSWDSEVFTKLRDVLELMINDKVPTQTLRDFPLNDDVVSAAITYRKLLKKLVPLTPAMTFRVHYVSFGKSQDINDYRNSKRKILQKALQDRLPQRAKVIVEYVGAERINELDAQTGDFDVTLPFVKPPVRDGKALIGLVRIRDYAKFVRRPRSTAIRDEMFAVNVRAFAGESARVNAAIGATLEADDNSTFWWLNNGITIIADDAKDPKESQWVLTNPLIVNGLQTSSVIHAKSVGGTITRKRLTQALLVRVVKEPDPAVRESIIIGTNNQTTVNSLQLHANEPLQVRLERYLRTQGWYYERRRYQYRGSTAPAGKTRSMTELAQAVIAVHLLAPDTARARPATQLGTKVGYKNVFNEEYPEEMYLKALRVMEAVELYLQTPAGRAHGETATNTRFYLATGYIITALKLKSLNSFSAAKSVKQIKLTAVNSRLSLIHTELDAAVAELDDGKVSRDQIYKGTELKARLFNRLLTNNGQI